MQRTATPCTPVRFRPAPPSSEALPKAMTPVARVVELVDTGDLKSPGRLGRAGSSPAPGTTFMSPTHHTYK